MSALGIAAWLAAVAAVLVRVLRGIVAARVAPAEPVARGEVIVAAAAIVGLAGAGAWLWSAGPARVGDARLRARGDATAALELRSAVVGGERIVVGFSPDAKVELPSSWTFDEAKQGGDLLTIDATAAILRVTPTAASTRVVLRAAFGAVDPRRLAREVERDGCARATTTSVALEAPGVIAALLCRDDRALAALAIERVDGAVRLWPLIRRGGALAPHTYEIAAGDAVQLGAASTAVPGLDAWEVPAPRGHGDVIVAPDDVRASCAAWGDGAAAAVARPRGAHGCELRLASVYDLELARTAPDLPGIDRRAAWAAAVVVLPAVLALLALAAGPRGAIDRRRYARLLALGWIAVVLAALAILRLTWAHRIDLLRDQAPIGTRTLLAQGLAAACGAAIAGLAALALLRGRARGVGAVAIGVTWLALAGVGFAGAMTRTIAISACAGVVLVVVGALRWRPRIAPALALLGLGVAALATHVVAPSLVAAKLTLAWLIPPLAYLALRERSQPLVALAALATALVSVFHLDTGVTLAIAAPGVVIAAVVVTHDLLYHARDARLLDRWERHQRPITLGHAAVLATTATLALIACLVGGADLPARATAATLHLPAVIAAALLASAFVAARRGLGRAALVPAVVAAIAATVWLQRDELVTRAVASDDATGRRIAAVVDPGYALLRDERSLVAALTAWRETRVSGDPLVGDGYFAATIEDPGVAVSIENDYLAVLVVRELGVIGLVGTAALLLATIAGAWAMGAGSRRPGAAGTRARAVVALTAGAVTIYQPLAALGVLPLTGVSWPGLGIDSPSDVLVHLAIVLWLAAPGRGVADGHERSVRASPRWRRATTATAAAVSLAIVAGVAIVARASWFAARRPSGAVEVVDGIDRAIAYTDTLTCAGPGIPSTILGVPSDDATARFHHELGVRWAAARPAAIAAVEAFTRDGTCTARAGAWRGARRGDACALSLDLGWPRARLEIARDATVRCTIAADRDALWPLRAPPARPPRIRVVGAEPTGADRGELISDHTVIRLRPGAAKVTPGSEPALHLGGEAILDGDVTVTAIAAGVHVRGHARLLIADVRPRWREVAIGDGLDVVGVAVLATPTRRWLVRAGAGVPPLLADDAVDRRAYVYGGAVPELGWINPYDVRRSLGLDGWIHAAAAAPAGPAPWRDTTGEHAWCGTLAPPPSMPVCAPSRADGVIECRVAIAPSIEVELRHLLEALAIDPERALGRGTPATRAAFVLLRGDTGEILAEGDHVPGRAGTAYAPGTPALAQALERMREEPGEASAEKFDLHRAIAIGSTLKPLVARAAEQVAPRITDGLAITFDDSAPATCRRRGVHSVLGHCPPRDLLDHGGGVVSFHEYLAESSNAYQATLGLVALGWPDGVYELAGTRLSVAEVLAEDATGWPAPLEISRGDRRVLGPRRVRLEPLRETPFWRRLEALLGRPMCALGSRDACAAAADRRDLCAARALPIAAPTADVRHLIAIGPSSFDLHVGADDRDAVPVAEYLQLLRGSGVHPVGSLAQLTDAFNRLIYDPARPDEAYALAASWFPVPAAGRIPASACTRAGGAADRVLGDDGGLCGVIRDGTAARGLGALLDDPRVVLYGAKTGTIDSLGDVAERRGACEAWNRAHTIAGAAAQPYQLSCGGDVPDDSLLVVSFAVRGRTGLVPLTLGLHLERTGKGVASLAARIFVEALAAELAP